MPRILLVLEYPTLAGGEMSMLATLGAVRDAGFEVVAAAPPAGRLHDALKRHGVPVKPFVVGDRTGRRLPLDQLRQRLTHIVKETAPDLLHANSLSTGRLSGPVRAALSVPGIAHLRDIIRLSRQAIADLNCHSRLVAVSQATRDYHVAAGLAAEKTVVVPNGVDLETFRPRPSTGRLCRELGLAPESPLIGTIGQISLRKGMDVLFAAARHVLAQRGDTHFVIVGARFSEKEESRGLENDLRRAAASGPLSGHIHLLGFRPDVARLVNELTLLAHPARQEPLGRVLLEAAAAGVAIVATEVGGTREIFPHGLGAARLVPPDNPEWLAREMVRLLADSAERERMADAARKRATDAFGIRRAAAALVAQYETVLDRPERGKTT